MVGGCLDVSMQHAHLDENMYMYVYSDTDKFTSITCNLCVHLVLLVLGTASLGGTVARASGPSCPLQKRSLSPDAALPSLS